MNWTEDWFLLWALVWFLALNVVPRFAQRECGLLVSVLFLAWIDLSGLSYVLSITCVSWLLLQSRANWWRSGAVILLACVGFILLKFDVSISNDSDIVIIGLAFIVLRLIHVAFEAALGRVHCGSLIDFLSYMLFLPTLIAGPIHRIDSHQRDDRRRRWDSGLVSIGLERILYGLVKIVVLGGWIGIKLENISLTVDMHVVVESWYTCFLYGWVLYFTFSGYSSVSIGLALTAGYRIPENFSYPFLASNIADFWRKWHATLSAWCRSYVAEPTMALTRSRWLAIIAAMVVLGVWHEVSLRYLAWGLYHGVGIAVYQRWAAWRSQYEIKSSIGRYANHVFGVLLTQAFVILSFAITSSPDLPHAWGLIRNMFGLGSL